MSARNLGQRNRGGPRPEKGSALQCDLQGHKHREWWSGQFVYQINAFGKLCALRSLAWNSRTPGAIGAAGRGKLDFALSCTSEAPDACADPRKALSNLPLQNLLGVSLRNTLYRNEPATNGVQARYMQPVNDGRWPEAEFSFNSSAPDGRSWMVLMKGADKVEAIQMRRSTVIRH